jgi:DNA-binding XRE family transcriptional regulator/desulfoferrodoxin (superoxide reductase-like protein)
LDCSKIGALIYRLRKEKRLTQKQVAEHMNISDKTISKWERGLGCPDVNLLGELSDFFEINIEKILDGNLESNDIEQGNLKRIKFYVCPICGNVINNTGNAEVSCCGRKLSPLTAKPVDEIHTATIEDTDGEYYITFNHEMTKSHFISFVAYVTNDKLLLVKLYPEQAASVSLPKMSSDKLLHKYNRKLYFYCSKHGLYLF